MKQATLAAAALASVMTMGVASAQPAPDFTGVTIGGTQIDPPRTRGNRCAFSWGGSSLALDAGTCEATTWRTAFDQEASFAGISGSQLDGFIADGVDPRDTLNVNQNLQGVTLNGGTFTYGIIDIQGVADRPLNPRINIGYNAENGRFLNSGRIIQGEEYYERDAGSYYRVTRFVPGAGDLRVPIGLSGITYSRNNLGVTHYEQRGRICSIHFSNGHREDYNSGSNTCNELVWGELARVDSAHFRETVTYDGVDPTSTVANPVAFNPQMPIGLSGITYSRDGVTGTVTHYEDGRYYSSSAQRVRNRCTITLDTGHRESYNDDARTCAHFTWAQIADIDTRHHGNTVTIGGVDLTSTIADPVYTPPVDYSFVTVQAGSFDARGVEGAFNRNGQCVLQLARGVDSTASTGICSEVTWQQYMDETNSRTVIGVDPTSTLADPRPDPTDFSTNPQQATDNDGDTFTYVIHTPNGAPDVTNFESGNLIISTHRVGTGPVTARVQGDVTGNGFYADTNGNYYEVTDYTAYVEPFETIEYRSGYDINIRIYDSNRGNGQTSVIARYATYDGTYCRVFQHLSGHFRIEQSCETATWEDLMNDYSTRLGRTMRLENVELSSTLASPNPPADLSGITINYRGSTDTVTGYSSTSNSCAITTFSGLTSGTTHHDQSCNSLTWVEYQNALEDTAGEYVPINGVLLTSVINNPQPAPDYSQIMITDTEGVTTPVTGIRETNGQCVIEHSGGTWTNARGDCENTRWETLTDVHRNRLAFSGVDVTSSVIDPVFANTPVVTAVGPYPGRIRNDYDYSTIGITSSGVELMVDFVYDANGVCNVSPVGGGQVLNGLHGAPCSETTWGQFQVPWQGFVIFHNVDLGSFMDDPQLPREAELTEIPDETIAYHERNTGVARWIRSTETIGRRSGGLCRVEIPGYATVDVVGPCERRTWQDLIDHQVQRGIPHVRLEGVILSSNLHEPDTIEAYGNRFTRLAEEIYDPNTSKERLAHIESELMPFADNDVNVAPLVSRSRYSRLSRECRDPATSETRKEFIAQVVQDEADDVDSDSPYAAIDPDVKRYLIQDCLAHQN